MAVVVSLSGTTAVVDLSGWDRVMNWRRRIEFASATVRAVSVAERSSLEPMIEHRALGCGTHSGSKRPGRRRIGTMLGRGVPGKQFWAVQAGPGGTQLIVLDLINHRFERAVLEVDDPQAFRATIHHALTETSSKRRDRKRGQ